MSGSRPMGQGLPVVANVGVVVIGGTTAGVAAAEAAARGGARVFLVAPRPYLGEDLCATLRLEMPAGRTPSTPWEKRLFPDGPATTPGHVKATLAAALLEAGVSFWYGSYVTGLLRDGEGHPCGVIVANRGGNQAIGAQVIIDATEYAWVCRLAGCRATPWPGGQVHFERVVLEGGGEEFKRRIHAFDIGMPDFSFASLMAAEQTARGRTPAEGILRAAESLFCVPPHPIVCRDTEGGRLDPFRAADEDRLYVLSGCAGVPRERAAELLQPTGLTGIAADAGRAAAEQAGRLAPPGGAIRVASRDVPVSGAEIRATSSGFESPDPAGPRISIDAGPAPVLDEVDVVVVGGGTAGAAAAIGAARQGARTLVVEYQEGLGGTGTLGLIGKPYHGKRIGFAREVPFPPSVEAKMEWYRREIRAAGGTIWLGALGCGAAVAGHEVTGAVVATPEGRGVVRAKVVVDATGNADIAIAAGAAYMYGEIEAGDIAMQGTGLSRRRPGECYRNSDFLLVDESDMTDVWRALTSVYLARGGEGYDTVPLIQTRERRRVMSDFVMRYEDQVAGRTYPDNVVFSESDYDSHGYPSSPFFYLLPHDEESRKANHPAPGGSCYTPYRCLLPRGLNGILVAGLGIGMDRDATAMVRMQYDLANQGYAAGVAASMAARAGIPPRRIDVRELQAHLVRAGCLPEAVLSQGDAFPLSESAIAQAVAEYGRSTNPATAGRPLAIMLTHPEVARGLARRAYEEATGRAKLLYAQVLAVWGDQTGVPVLLAALEENPEWDAKILQGRMAEYAYLPTPVDAIVFALGCAGDRAVLPALVKRIDGLDETVTLSHHRSVALALEKLADPAAAAPLEALLRKPGMQGHVMTAIPRDGGNVEERTASLREITLARALYRCGDHEGLGRRILEDYRRDLRGLFRRHANAVLEQDAGY